jgi:hypothetical protein
MDIARVQTLAGGVLLGCLIAGCSASPSISTPRDGGTGEGSGADGGAPDSGSSSSGGGSSSSDGGSSSSDGGSSSSGGGSSGGGGLGDGSAPDGGWVNLTGNLANIQSGCGNLSFISAKPDEDLLIAGIGEVGLYGTTTGGTTWQALGTGSGSTQITSYLTSIVYDPTTTTQFWGSGIYGSPPFKTTDDGVTLTSLGTSIHHNDLISVDLTDPARKTLLAGGHEEAQTVYLSTDGGMTWTNVGGGLPAGSTCTFPLVIDSQTFLVGCYGTQPNGVFRSTNAGSTWTQVTSSGGGAPPLHASDGSIYWVSDDGASMTRSTDNGATWTDVIGSGVLVGFEGHLTVGAPVELPDGRIASLGSQYVLISADQGSTWNPATAPLPQESSEDLHGLAYSKFQKAFYVWHNLCGNGTSVPVPTDAVMAFPFDYESQ